MTLKILKTKVDTYRALLAIQIRNFRFSFWKVWLFKLISNLFSQFPDLFFGSIATSAPVVAEVDFPGYMEVCGSSDFSA